VERSEGDKGMKGVRERKADGERRRQESIGFPLNVNVSLTAVHISKVIRFFPPHE
jgi:hypothetical protein